MWIPKGRYTLTELLAEANRQLASRSEGDDTERKGDDAERVVDDPKGAAADPAAGPAGNRDDGIYFHFS